MSGCVLNFQSSFAPLVESGQKPHTIRARRTDGRDPLPGDMLHLYTGLRTKTARLLRREPCQYAIEVTIQPSAGNVHHILLGGKPMEQHEIDALAEVDGFKNATDFVQYFGKTYGLPFTGLLIGWEPIPAYATRH
jgi:hypothetical protein